MKMEKRQAEIKKLLDTKPMHTLINDGVFNPTLDCPKIPKKPRLVPGHNSIQALNYAEALVVYEQKKANHTGLMKAYREDAAAAHSLFKWACLMDISGLCTDLRPKYLQATKIAWTMAWDRGHSAGLHEVYQELLELSELLKCI
jgi:hypothetical protein